MRTTLKLGSSGADVEYLTERLHETGFLSSRETLFDNEVRKAVRAFQAHHVGPNGRPLSVDGIVGPLSWWALEGNVTPVMVQPPNVMPGGGSRAGRAALKVALAEMNAGASEEGGNNRGPWVKKYLNGFADEGNSWCAGFVSWCYQQSSTPMPFRYSVGAQSIRNKFKAKGWGFDAADTPPEPGDIVVWWRGTTRSWQGHIGLVHHCSDGILYTVEGNKGNFPAPVRQFDYVLDRMPKLLGFGRVPD